MDHKEDAKLLELVKWQNRHSGVPNLAPPRKRTGDPEQCAGCIYNGHCAYQGRPTDICYYPAN